MQLIFEKDGQLNEKYISKRNNIPYCVEDVKKLMAQLVKDKEPEMDWAKSISPVLCEMVYTFILQIIARPVSLANKVPSTVECIADLMRNINTKFPELAEEAKSLYHLHLVQWQRKQQKAQEIKKKPKVERKTKQTGQKESKEPKELKGPKEVKERKKQGQGRGRKPGKYQLISTPDVPDQELDSIDGLNELQLQQMLDYLSENDQQH